MSMSASHSPLPRRVSLGVAPRFEAGGVWIEAVEEGSSAAAGGVRPEDRLVRVGEVEVVDSDSLSRSLRAAARASTIDLAIERDGTTLQLVVARRFSPVEAAAAELVWFDLDPAEEHDRVGPEGPLRLRGHLVRATSASWLVVVAPGLSDTPCEIVEGSYGACFGPLVEELRRGGVSTLRFDRRGVGDSEGAATRSSHADDLRDLQAALRFAREHHGGGVALFGHSTGAIAAALAREELGPAGNDMPLAIFGAPAEPWFECLRDGTRRHHERHGHTAAEAEALASEEHARLIAWTRARGPGTFEGRSASWHAELALHDPVELFAISGRRNLILAGELDDVVPPDAATRLARASTTTVCRCLPGLDHAMQQRPPGGPCPVASELLRWLGCGS